MVRRSLTRCVVWVELTGAGFRVGSRRSRTGLISGSGRAGIRLLDGGQGGMALHGRRLDRIQVFVGEQTEQERDNQGGDGGRLFA